MVIKEEIESDVHLSLILEVQESIEAWEIMLKTEKKKAPNHSVYNKKKAHSDSVTEAIIHAICSTDSVRQLNATAHIRKVLLTGQYSTIQCVIDFGVVPRFVEFLRIGSTKLQVQPHTLICGSL
jgi:hypothetical protein